MSNNIVFETKPRPLPPIVIGFYQVVTMTKQGQWFAERTQYKDKDLAIERAMDYTNRTGRKARVIFVENL